MSLLMDGAPQRVDATAAAISAVKLVSLSVRDADTRALERLLFTPLHRGAAQIAAVSPPPHCATQRATPIAMLPLQTQIGGVLAEQLRAYSAWVNAASARVIVDALALGKHLRTLRAVLMCTHADLLHSFVRWVTRALSSRASAPQEEGGGGWGAGSGAAEGGSGAAT